MSQGCADPNPLSRPERTKQISGARDATRELMRLDACDLPATPERDLCNCHLSMSQATRYDCPQSH